MQIHELDDYNGNLNSSAYAAVDNGSDTGKVSIERLLAGVNNEILQAEETLNSRIDNILTSPAPSAEEVTDARLGDNGITYASLGAAIRGQVSILNNAVEGATGSMMITWEQGTLRLSDGSEQNSSNAIRTKKIVVKPGDIYLIHNTNNLKLSLFEYKADSSLNRASMYQRTTIDNKIKIHSDTASIRILAEATGITPNVGDSVALVNITDGFSGLNDIITSAAALMGVKNLNPAYGYINTAGSTVNLNNISVSSNYAYSAVSCSEGDIFLIKGYGATGAKLWCFIDSSGNVLRAAPNDTNTNGNYLAVTAPENASHFIFNSRTSVDYAAYLIAENSADVIKINPSSYDFINGRYSTIDGLYQSSFAGTYICTKDYINDSVTNIIATDSIKVAVIKYSKADEGFVEAVYWIRPNNNSPYFFDHSNYLYKLYVGYDSEETIVNREDLLSQLFYTCYSSEYAKYVERIKAQNQNQQQIIDGLSSAVQSLKEHSEYNIAYANAGTPIELLNYTGNTQNVHPKVLYFEEGFGGHNYWMAYTPYPFSADGYENPCIAYSDDGEHWTNIDNNPIDNPNGVGYDSDTHLVYDSDSSTLECWYRYVGPASQSPREETIYRQKSTDGVTWGAKELVYSNTSGNYSLLLSPAIIFDGSLYHIWVCSSENAAINYYTAPKNNISNWTRVRVINLTYMDVDNTRVYPWHIDVIQDEDNYIILAMCRNGTEITAKCSLFITTSSDNITYSDPVRVIGGSSNSWDKYMYRSTIVKVDDDYVIFYSAGSPLGTSSFYNKAVWGIGISKSKTLNNFIGKMI